MANNFKQFAVTLMRELEANNLSIMVLLQHDDIAQWWGKYLADKEAKLKREAEALRKRKIKEQDAADRKKLIKKFTKEELKILGVRA